jgi:DNA-binding SARP family transcriptional activator
MAARHAAAIPPRRGGREWLRGVGALIVITVLLAGIPVLLITAAGIPFAHGLPSWAHLASRLRQPDDGQLLLDVLLILAWTGWAAFTISVAAETVALARHAVAPTLFGLGAMQPAAGRLLASVALLLPAGGAALHLGAAALHPPLAATAPPRPTISATPAPARPQPATGSTSSEPAAHAVQAAVKLPVYVVGTDPTGQRDTLWSIAARHLGNPLRWNEIAQLNSGQRQADGTVFTDPNLIRPGWTLRLPEDATGLCQSEDRPSNAPPVPSRRITAPSPAPRQPAAASEQALPPVPAPVLAPPDPSPTPTAIPTRTPAVTPPPPAHAPADEEIANPHHRGPSVPLGPDSEISAAVATALLLLLTLRRLRSRQRYQPRPPRPAQLAGHPPYPPPLQQLLASQPSGARDLTPSPDSYGPIIGGGRWDISVQRDGNSQPGQPTSCTWTDRPALFLSGDGGADAARALLTAALTQPQGTIEVWAIGDILADLLPDLTKPPAVRQIPDLSTARRQLQLEVLSRSRLLADDDVPDATSYRRQNPEDPFPALLLLAHPFPAEFTQLAGLMQQAAHLDIAALLLVDEPVTTAGAWIDVSAHGDVLRAHPPDLAGQLTDSRTYRLSSRDAVTLLAATLPTETDSDDPLRAPDDTANQDAVTPAPTDQATPVWNDDDSAVTGLGPTYRVQLLGRVRIWVNDLEVETGLRQSARQVLAWYLVHPDGRPIDAAAEAVWPELTPKRGKDRFWNALGNLRARLREVGDDPDLQILYRADGVYQPRRFDFAVDLWTFQAALERAAATRVHSDQIDALTEATTVYTGPFATDADYLWAAPIREELHRRVLDAHARLADLHAETDQPEQAIATLERALTRDPHAEDIYRRLMRHQHAAGRIGSVQLLWKQLNNRLADIDTEPADETRRVYRQCLTPASAPADRMDKPEGAAYNGQCPPP